MLEVLGILLAVVEVLGAPELSTDATIWMDDLFSFRQHEKHLEKPSLKDLKNKVTNYHSFYVLCRKINNKHELH